MYTYRTEVRVSSNVLAYVGMPCRQSHDKQQGVPGSLSYWSLAVDVGDEEGEDQEAGWSMVCISAGL